MYMMNNVDLCEKLNVFTEYRIYIVLGEMLWRVREYENCIRYTRKAIDLLKSSGDKDKDQNTMFCSNTLALALKLIDVKLLDHIIISQDEFVSFRRLEL